MKKQVYGVPSWRANEKANKERHHPSLVTLLQRWWKVKKTHTQIPFIQFPLLSCSIRLFTTNSALILPAHWVFLILRWHRTSVVVVVVCGWLLDHFFVPPSWNDTFSCVIHYKTFLIWRWWRKPERNNFVLMIVWLIPPLEQYNHATCYPVAVPTELRCTKIINVQKSNILPCSLASDGTNRITACGVRFLRQNISGMPLWTFFNYTIFYSSSSLKFLNHIA